MSTSSRSISERRRFWTRRLVGIRRSTGTTSEKASGRGTGANGQALLVVLAVVSLLALLPAVIFEDTNGSISTTLQAQNQKAALAAAEAGAASYLSQLSSDPSFTRYNDVTCNSPSPAAGFYLAGSACAGSSGGTGSYSLPVGSVSDWVSVPNTSVQEQFVYTVTDTDPSNPTSPLELVVTGRAGSTKTPSLDQYRTLVIQLTSQLTNAIFSNYNTSSPYTYSNSEAFTLLQDGINLALSAASDLGGGSVDGIQVSTIQGELTSMLGSGPTGDIKLGQLLCGYHSYQPNPVADLVQEALAMVPSLLSTALEPSLGSFDPLGLPIGQDLISVMSDITNAITSDLQSALFSSNFLGSLGQSETMDGHTFDLWTGPFPLVCNVSELYGSSSSSYYGLKTSISGPVYSNDQFYACTSDSGTSDALANDTVKIGAEGSLSSSGTGPQVIPVDPAPGGAFTQDNLPAISFTIPLINYTFDVSTGCSNTPTTTAAVAPEPTPVPDFSAIEANATCQFYGPTFIDFQSGSATVWSPDTAEAGGTGNSSACGSSSPYTVNSSSAGDVLYVHNLPESDTCQAFPTSFALPFGQTTPIQDHSCYWGDALVQGTYTGDWTIGASNDIVITGNVVAGGSNGMQTSSLGLAPGGNVPISEPAVNSSGVYYPQGNVVVNHPVVSGANDNNCSFISTPSGLPSTCSPGIPSSVPEASWSTSGCSFSLTNIGGYFECLIGGFYESIDHYMYNIVNAGYYCGMGSQAEALIDLSSCSSATSGGLYLNAGVSNDNPTAAPAPTFSQSAPTCSDWSANVILPSSCETSWFDYYWAFGSEAGTAFDEFCDLFTSCPSIGGYESQLATWEATWVHGPLNSFPAIYNPTIDADILASNSSSSVQGASVGSSTPANITNGSFTVQNVDSGNSGSYSRAGHGLGTLTENGAVVESYANGLANAGLTTSHFHLFDSSCDASADACYVSSGYHVVNINYSPDVVLNPPPYLVQELQGVDWVSQVSEIAPAQALPGI